MVVARSDRVDPAAKKITGDKGGNYIIMVGPNAWKAPTVLNVRVPYSKVSKYMKPKLIDLS